jgi:hypothetical protein
MSLYTIEVAHLIVMGTKYEFGVIAVILGVLLLLALRGLRRGRGTGEDPGEVARLRSLRREVADAHEASEMAADKKPTEAVKAAYAEGRHAGNDAALAAMRRTLVAFLRGQADYLETGQPTPEIEFVENTNAA